MHLNLAFSEVNIIDFDWQGPVRPGKIPLLSHDTLAIILRLGGQLHNDYTLNAYSCLRLY